MNRRHRLACCLVPLVVALSVPGRAHAYLDPGAGSYIFQLLLGALVGAVFVVRLYWKKIKALFRRRSRREERHPPTEPPDAQR